MTDTQWSAWLGQMQTELGVLSSNAMLLNIQNAQLTEENTNQAALIDALKERILQAEKDNQVLKEQIQPHRKKNGTNTTDGRTGQ
jgi:hypothetical protein